MISVTYPIEKLNKKNIMKPQYDGLVKSPKMANFQFSHLMISIGYEFEF